MGNNPKTHISDLWPDLDLTCDLLKKILMRIGIFSFRAFDRRLAAPISSGVKQGAEYAPPPSGARSAEYPSGARVNGLNISPAARRLTDLYSRL